jgi:hypothetical protein
MTLEAAFVTIDSSFVIVIMFIAQATAFMISRARNTKGRSITVPFTSCLTGLESAVRPLTFFVIICKTDLSKPVKQEVNGSVILPPLVFHV